MLPFNLIFISSSSHQPSEIAVSPMKRLLVLALFLAVLMAGLVVLQSLVLLRRQIIPKIGRPALEGQRHPEQHMPVVLGSGVACPSLSIEEICLNRGGVGV